MKVNLEDVVLYSVGLMHCSVCAAVTVLPEEVAVRVNVMCPTGIESDWRISNEATFATGEPHPTPCEDNPETRLHWLLDC